MSLSLIRDRVTSYRHSPYARSPKSSPPESKNDSTPSRKRRRLGRSPVGSSQETTTASTPSGWLSRAKKRRHPRYHLLASDLPATTYESTLPQLPLFKHMDEGGSPYNFESIVPSLKQLKLDTKENTETQYRALLDLFDKFWVEYHFINKLARPNSAGEPTLPSDVRQLMRRVKSCIRFIEQNPEVAKYELNFDDMRRNRAQHYPPNHPMRTVVKFLRPPEDYVPDLDEESSDEESS